MEKEYVVIVHKGVDLAAFDAELAAATGDSPIPNRSVQVADPREGSKRMTHWMLTDDEAQTLQSDQRVLAVEIPPHMRDDIEFTLDAKAKRGGSFKRKGTPTASNVNWGLRRSNARTNIYFGQEDVNENLESDYVFALDGAGVDVVIQDTGIQADHPEFQDYNGNSRVQQIDWYAASGLSGSMPTEHYTDYDGHGTHVAGIVAGKTYGWAKNSRIYAVKLDGLEGTSDPNGGIPVTDAFDIIKEWHKRKKAPSYTPTDAEYNPATGVMTLTVGLNSFIVGDKIKIIPYGITFTCAKDDYATTHSYPRGEGVPNDSGQDPFYDKEIEITAVTSDSITVNIGISSDTSEHRFEGALEGAIIVPGVKQKRPTVVNMSWGYITRYLFINGGNYRGTAWTGTAKNPAYGMTGVFDGIGYRHGIRVSSVDVDLEELIDAGVIVCVAAGNSYHKIDVEGGVDYNNYYNSLLYGARYYQRGSSPYNERAIIVGNIDSDLTVEGLEQKANSSETGPGVTVYAPGTNIFSATSTVNKFNDAPYPSDNTFRIANISGTSMAAPQMAGLIATYGEIKSDITPAKIKTWIINNSKAEQIDTNGNQDDDYGNYRSLMGGNDRYGFQPYNDANVVSFAGQETIDQGSEDVTPTYKLTSTNTSVDEGQNFTITLQTTNLVNGTIIPYTITGVTSADIGNALLVDNFIVGTTMQKTFSATADDTFDDGADVFTLTLNDVPTASVAVTINDTSYPDPIYSLAADTTNVNEGSSVTITATAQNVLTGTVIPYIISGVTSADIGGDSLTGNLTVGSDMSRTYTLAADGLAEGDETMTFTWASQSIDIYINDTSNIPITYTLTPSATTVDEGDTFTVTLDVSGGINGVQLPYTITGVSTVDLGNTSLTGTFTVGSDTQKTFTIAEDAVTEGTETFTITLNDFTDVNASVTINDTSTTVVSGSDVVTNPGSGTFTVPDGVTSLSILAVGGGGGAGTNLALGAGQITGGGGSGAVGWLNNVTVTPGQVISYTVGAGGAGNNDGGLTSITIGGTSYHADGGNASTPVNLTSLNPFELHSGGAGGTLGSGWTGGTVGAQGGSSYRTFSGAAFVGGGAGGSGTGGIGQKGYPDALSTTSKIIDPRNAAVAPGSFTTTTPSTNNAMIATRFSASIFHFQYGGAGDFLTSTTDEQGKHLEVRWNAFVNSLTYGSEDAYYFVFKDANDAVVHVLQSTDPSPSGSEFVVVGDYSVAFTTWLYSIQSSNMSHATYAGTTYSDTTSGTSDVKTIELRGGVATGATALNTTVIGTFQVLPDGDIIGTPNETAGAGGGHGYTEDWQSGTGIVVGGRGGATSLTKGLSASQGTAASTVVSQTISGAGIAIFGEAGGDGNVVSSVSSYAVGEGAGGVMVHGLTPSGSRTRAETGGDGGILFVWPGSIASNQFKAPSYTLNSSKTNCNEGSTFTITCANNLTENATQIPYTITGVTSADISGASLTNYFTVQTNNKTFTVTADDTFEGAETFNLALNNGADNINVTINDTSDGTQSTFTASIVNSGSTAYLFSSATDRNGTVSGANPYVVVDKGDTITWSVNASGHPFYIKDVQGAGTNNQTANVTNQGVTSGDISYTPRVDGRKYFQCSTHTDMNGPIYIVDDHFATLVTGTGGDVRAWTRTVHSPDGSQITAYSVNNNGNSDVSVVKTTKHGSPVWNKTFNHTGTNYQTPAIGVDSLGNVYIARADDNGTGMYVQMLDGSGTEQWGRSYLNSGGETHIVRDLAIDGNNIIVVGVINDPGIGNGSFVYKLSKTNGDVISGKKISTSDRNAKFEKVVTDTSGNIFIAGCERRPVGQQSEENTTRLWKLNSSLTLQWARWYWNANSYADNSALAIDGNGSPIIGLNVSSGGSRRSFVITVNGTTGAIGDDFELDASDFANTQPFVYELAYDTVNDKIFAVGAKRYVNQSNPFGGFAYSFDTSLTDVTPRFWRTSHNGAYVLIFRSCDIDNTLDPNTRLYVLGTGNSSKSTTNVSTLIASLPINDEDVTWTSGEIQFDEYRYSETGTVTAVTGTPYTEYTYDGQIIDNEVVTASSGTGYGTLVTDMSTWDDQKMALYWGAETESQEASDPTYALTVSSTVVDEGQSFTVTLDTTNVPNGTNVPFTITGVSTADIDGQSLTGNFVVNNNSAVVTINVTADNVTD